MNCNDGVKKEILAHIVGFVEQHEALTLSANELQFEINTFVLQLNQRYGMGCVREVLAAFNNSLQANSKKVLQ